MNALKLKKILAVAVSAVGLAAVAASTVTIDKIEDGDVWSTKKVTYTVADVPEPGDTYTYTLAFDVTAYSVTTNIKMGVAQNGTFTYMLDTAAIFGETRKDPKAKIRVSIEKEFDEAPVQLWENGPFFARCNVGATKPEDYGYYFWWGDTVGYKRNGSSWDAADGSKTGFSFSSSPTSGRDTTWLKNNGWIGDDGNLVSTHDAATVHWGTPWRMMTDEELQKLVNDTYTTTEWTTQNGVYGCRVTGKGAYAGNSIFLPAAGYGAESDLDHSGSDGGCWSSTPNSDSNYAWYLYFDSSRFDVYNRNRYFGQPVRPVRGFAE